MKTTEPEASETRQDTPQVSRRVFSRRAAMPGLLAAIALIWLVFQVTTDGVFLTDRNLINLLRQTAVIAIVALGLLVVIAQGEIDLSVGSLMGVCVTVTAIIEDSGAVPFWVTILIVMAIGLSAGLWNGFWVGFLGIPAFVATLGGLLMFRGIALALSGGRTLTGIGQEIRTLGSGYIEGAPLVVFLVVALLVALIPLRRLPSIPRDRRNAVIRRVVITMVGLGLLGWATLSYRGLPIPVAFALVIGMIFSWALRNTVWGRNVYAVGANRTASRVAGIRTRRQVVLGFVVSGTLTAIASILFVGRLGSAPPLAGLFLELDAISAVVIGGASLYGGTGNVTGALLGALLTQSLLNGLSLMNVVTAYQYITSGLVLMLAVFLDAVSKRGGRLVVRQ